MRFILRKDVPTLAKGETGMCIDSFSIITHTQFEGLREQSLKDIKAIPVELLEELRNFLNETYAEISVDGSFEITKQDKLVVGDNITIDENNVISASGGIETVDWQDIENKPELYNKTEIDTMMGDIESALDAILGV